MLSFADLLAVMGLFLVRFGIPVAITAGLVYLLKRLDRRWEEEARLQPHAAQPAERPSDRPAVPQPAKQPAAPKRVPAPAPAIPFIPPHAIRPGPQPVQPGLAAAQFAQPCWDIRGCSEDAKASCAAPKNPNVPCWQARFDAEGRIPEECVNCDIFQRYPLM